MEKILLWIISILTNSIYQYRGMNLFLIILIRTSLLSMLLAVTLSTFTKLFKQYLSARLVYCLWLVIIVAMALPLQFENRFNLSSLLDHSVKTQSQEDGQTSYPTPELQYTVDASQKNPVTIRENKTRNTENHIHQTWYNNLSILDTLFLIWLSGFFILSLITIRSKIAFHRRLAIEQSRSEDNYSEDNYVDQIQLLQESQKQLNINKNITLIISDHFPSPGICSFLSPKLILPRNTIHQLTTEELKLIYLHELVHLLHFDLLIFNIIHLLKLIYWFNPLIWYLSNKLEKVCESACDESVLNLLSEDQHKNYGTTLIKSVSPSSTVKVPMLNANKSFKDIKRRIIMISNYKKKKTNLGILSATILSMVFVFILIFGNPIVASVKGTEEPPTTLTAEQTMHNDIGTSSNKQVKSNSSEKPTSVIPIYYDKGRDQIIVAKTNTIKSISDITIDDNLGKKCYITVTGTTTPKTYDSTNKLVKSLKLESKNNTSTLTITSDQYIALASKEDSDSIYLTIKKANKVYKNIVVIDAGHGGTDFGAVRDKKKTEKELTLELALMIKQIAEQTPDTGVKFYLIRSNDKKIELADRAKVANELGGLYINLHYSDSPNTSANGMLIYYGTDDKEGKSTAQLFSNRLSKDLSIKNSKINKFDLYMIKSTKNTAISIEPAYISNERDYKKITAKGFTEKTAVAIINAAREYYGLEGDIVSAD